MVLLAPIALPLAEVMKVISSWTPTLVLVALFRKVHPDDTLKEFVKRQFSERLSMSTLAGIIMLQFLLFVGTLLFSSAARNVPIGMILTTSWGTLFLAFGDSFVRGPLGEEMGWRGFLQGELQKEYNPLKSAIVVGLIWGFWHTPLWFISSAYTGTQLLQYVAYFLIAIIATSIIITAFYNLNRNLIIPILVHQLFNFLLVIQTGDLLNNMGVTALLYAVAALVLILVNHEKCLYGKEIHRLGVTAQ